MKKASDYDQEVLDLYNLYVHSRISRREFLEGASKFAVGGMTATALLESLSPRYAEAQQVKPDDPRLKNEYVEFDSPNGTAPKIKGLMSSPADATGKLPAVLVVHENRGLTPHIEDITRRLGLEGFLAFAPDVLTSLGGYPGTDEAGVELQKKLDGGKMREDFVSGAEFLKTHPKSTGKVGAVGFCFGGGVVNQLAVRLSWLGAAVPFYGGQPTAADTAKIQAPLLLHYAGLDERINKGWPDYEAALKANNKTYTAFIYENCNHGFNNDTTPRYDEANAKLAWQRSIEFFKKYLA